jgi:hypothetical protein
VASEVVCLGDQDRVELSPIRWTNPLLFHGGALLGEMRNLPVDLAHDVLTLLVIRARLVPTIGERRSLEGIASPRALEELVEVTGMDAEGFD